MHFMRSIDDGLSCLRFWEPLLQIQFTNVDVLPFVTFLDRREDRVKLIHVESATAIALIRRDWRLSKLSLSIWAICCTQFRGCWTDTFESFLLP
jgi:hypothetical protein